MHGGRTNLLLCKSISLTSLGTKDNIIERKKERERKREIKREREEKRKREREKLKMMPKRET